MNGVYKNGQVWIIEPATSQWGPYALKQDLNQMSSHSLRLLISFLLSAYNLEYAESMCRVAMKKKISSYV